MASTTVRRRGKLRGKHGRVWPITAWMGRVRGANGRWRTALVLCGDRLVLRSHRPFRDRDFWSRFCNARRGSGLSRVEDGGVPRNTSTLHLHRVNPSLLRFHTSHSSKLTNKFVETPSGGRPRVSSPRSSRMQRSLRVYSRLILPCGSNTRRGSVPIPFVATWHFRFPFSSLSNPSNVPF